MIPKQLILAMLIEAALITATSILLLQPKVVFHGQSERFRSMALTWGLMLLSITFIWSVVFGSLISLHRFSFRI